MPEHARRFIAAPYDQFEDGDRVADWGADALFTRMPRPRAVDTAPPPRFRRVPLEPERTLALVDPPEDRRHTAAGEHWIGRDRRSSQSAEAAMLERHGLSAVERRSSAPSTTATEPHAAARDWEGTRPRAAATTGDRHTAVITGHPGGIPQPLQLVPAERRRPAPTPAEWLSAHPERLVAWAFVLGLLLILVAISTADAAAV